MSSIVDHKNYNPRIVEWMTDITRLNGVVPDKYPEHFLRALSDPEQLWQIAFREHISKTCQNLLICLFFCAEFGETIQSLRVIFTAFHRDQSRKYDLAFHAVDFEDALRTLEGGFLTIVGTTVRFVNPSLRDFLKRHLSDQEILIDCAKSAVSARWAEAIWEFSLTSMKMSPSEVTCLASAFLKFAPALVTLPTWREVRIESGFQTRSPEGLSNSRRIKLLLDWGEHSGEACFFDCARSLAEKPVDGFVSWRDGSGLVDLIGELSDSGYFEKVPDQEGLCEILIDALLKLLRADVPIDELDGISESTERWKHALPDEVTDAVRSAVMVQIDDIDRIVHDIDSETTLTDHQEILARFVSRLAMSTVALKEANDAIEKRLEEIGSEPLPAEKITASTTSFGKKDDFDDNDLQSLFASLLS